MWPLYGPSGQFEHVGKDNFGCLGQVAWGADDALWAVSQRDRKLVRVYSGTSVDVAQLPDDVLPRGVALGPAGEVYVGANRITHNQRQAEVWLYDAETGEFSLRGAVGGAQLEQLAVSVDGRVFFTDAAHTAIHEVLDEPFFDEETELINNGPSRKIDLASGAKHAGGAEAKNFFGHGPWRTQMLYGGVTPANAGGVASVRTPDGTEVVLVADTTNVKSLTANQFLHSWPLGGENTPADRKSVV